MDTCSLIVATIVTTQACFTTPTCRTSEDGKRQLCSAIAPTACPLPPPHYECVKADGSRYAVPADKADRWEGGR